MERYSRMSLIMEGGMNQMASILGEMSCRSVMANGVSLKSVMNKPFQRVTGCNEVWDGMASTWKIDGIQNETDTASTWKRNDPNVYFYILVPFFFFTSVALVTFPSNSTSRCSCCCCCCCCFSSFLCLRSCMAPGGLPFPVRMRLLEPDNTRHGAEDVGARVHGGEGNDEMLAPDHGRDEGKVR